MSNPRTIGRALTGVVILLAGSTGALSGEPRPPLCDLALQEERLELDEFRLALELARSGLAAYEKIYLLIEELWENDATERMIYLEARFDRDAARVALDRADLMVLRQQALIEYYRLACRRQADSGSFDSMRAARKRYWEAHCGSLSKAVEEAEIRLTFNRELLASVRDLRGGGVATRPDLILAELDVEQEEKRLEDAKTRVEACPNEVRSEPEPAR